MERRISQYKKLKCPNKHLLKEFKKYGIENFRFELVKKIEENENTQKVLDEAEDYFIQHYNTTDVDIGYNKKKGGKYKIDD